MPSLRGRLRAYLHVEYRAGERVLIRKIDFFILTFCCLSFLVNSLDRFNLTNAYVSGMREDLRFVGSQLNQINTCFAIGYVLGQIPSNLSLQYIRPRIWFPLMMVLWGGLTMTTAAARNPQSVMAIRFFQGLCEASTYVGTHYVLGAWYTQRELGKRSGIFTSAGNAGYMISGFIQSGIYNSMHGRAGLPGWRWLFIIDGLLTLPVALYGFLLFPDTPSTTTAFYLTEDERKLAVARMLPKPLAAPAEPRLEAPQTTAVRDASAQIPGPEGMPPANSLLTSNPSKSPLSFSPPPVAPASPAPSSSPLTLCFFKKVLASWQWWGFVCLWIIAGETESFGSNSLLALYLQSHPSHRYSVEEMNNYPTGVPAVGIVATMFWATLTDFLGGKRQLVGYYIGLTGVATSVMILCAGRYPLATSSTKITMAAYYWAGSIYACQATFFAWCNDAMRHEDAAFRGVVLAGMNMANNAVNAWWSIVFYGAYMAPWFTVCLRPFAVFVVCALQVDHAARADLFEIQRGMWAMIACSIALALWSGGLSWVIAKRGITEEVAADVKVASSISVLAEPKTSSPGHKHI